MNLSTNYTTGKVTKGSIITFRTERKRTIFNIRYRLIAIIVNIAAWVLFKFTDEIIIRKESSITPIRRSGNTTRIIDEAVQELFENGKVRILDHNDTRMSHRYILDKFIKRLDSEHGANKEGTRESFVIDRANTTVKFIKIK